MREPGFKIFVSMNSGQCSFLMTHFPKNWREKLISRIKVAMGILALQSIGNVNYSKVTITSLPRDSYKRAGCSFMLCARTHKRLKRLHATHKRTRYSDAFLKFPRSNWGVLGQGLGEILFIIADSEIALFFSPWLWTI